MKSGKKALEQITKEMEQEKENKMKTLSTKKTIVITVVATLVTVAVLVAQALYFYNLGAETVRADNARIQSEVSKQVVAASKENQK